MEYLQQVYLDINPNDLYTVVTAKQFDTNSRGIVARIMEDGREHTITGDRFELRVKKPDGHVVISSATINNDQSVTAIFNEQCLLVNGRAYADLAEIKNGEILSTAPFIIDIKPSPNPDKAQIESTDEYSILYDLINGADNVINTARDFAEDAEAWANGTRNNIQITSNDEAYNKNSKYWAGRAKNVIESMVFSIVPETGNLTVTFENP